MAGNLVDIMASLSLIMNEESDRLSARDRSHDLAELAAAKIRLAGVLDTELARLEREQPGWAEAMDEDARRDLADALLVLGEASAANAALLERQIDLSIEMMGAFAAEARRLSGKRASTYGARGDVSALELAPPISVNSEF